MYRIICMKLSLFLDGANNLLFQVREVRAKLIEDAEFLELLKTVQQFNFNIKCNLHLLRPKFSLTPKKLVA